MNTLSLNNLWNYIQGLSLSASNQRWLAERLIESASTAGDTKSQTLGKIDRALSQLKMINDGKMKAIPAEEILNEL